MCSVRLIARLDIKGLNLIKSVQLEGLRVIGSPNDYALNYYRQGADELIYMDCVASLYGRNSLLSVVESTTRDVFIPITVGGGIRSVEDVAEILRFGADKVAINSEAIANPKLISDVARRFGSQCVVISIDAKRSGDGWEAYTHGGRERSGLDAIEWAKRAVELGAGEILLTSVDREGTRKGFDLPLVAAVTDVVTVPVIASGGMGKQDDLIDVVNKANASAVAMADILHYKRSDLMEIRQTAISAGLHVRNYDIA